MEQPDLNMKVRRCAIYTRKSSEEGLEQNFNSLHSQRDACEAFIKSQASEGWRLVKTAYDDGGISGATMERPALQRLLADIREKLIDVVAVYKVDRLTRSLADFAKMVEIFDCHRVSFVAVTQQFNTTSSMGRLTLNVLLSFAQFEREVTGERIRDKIAASKQKGLWMGGRVPLGYDWCDRRLVVNETEAATVRHIFARYLELRSVRLLQVELRRAGVVSKLRVSKKGVESGGQVLGRGALYNLLANPIYLGEIRHRKLRHPGQHQAIVDRTVWEQVHRLLSRQAAHHRTRVRRTVSSPLAGKLFDQVGEPLYACGAGKEKRRYRYYVSRKVIQGAKRTERGWRLPALQLERAVANACRRMLGDRPALATVLHTAGVPVDHLQAALDAAEQTSQQLAPDAGLVDHLRGLVDRVQLERGGIRVVLDLKRLLVEPIEGRDSADTTMTRFIPLAMKQRGVELRMVIEGEAGRAPYPDPVLLRAVARGHRWFTELASGRASSIREIAQRADVSDSYVKRLIPLAFIAPEIVQKICDGSQPPTLSAEELKRIRDLPLEWRDQRHLLCRGQE